MKEKILDAFYQQGLYQLGDKLAFPLWLKGYEKLENKILEDFIVSFGIKDGEIYFVDEFLYHFQIYQTVNARNFNSMKKDCQKRG